MSEFSFKGLFDEQEKTDYVVQCSHPVFASYAMSTYASGQFYRFLTKHPGVITFVDIHPRNGTCSPVSHKCDKRGSGGSAYSSESACTTGGGNWIPHTEATCAGVGDWTPDNWAGHGAKADSVYDELFRARATDKISQPMFARYDILKKEYIEVSEVSDEKWGQRYPQAMAEMDTLINANQASAGICDRGSHRCTVPGSAGSAIMDKQSCQSAGGDWKPYDKISCEAEQGKWTPIASQDDVISGLILLNKNANKGKYRFLATDSPNVKATKLNVQLLLNEIQSSISGVVTYQKNLGFNLHPDCETFESGVLFQLNIYDETVQSRSNKRSVVQRGNPRFAMQPSHAFGVQYAGAIQTNGQAGVFASSRPGGENNPENLVAGELKLTWNANTSEWEGGNKQILARLLTDVAGVGLNNMNMEIVDEVTPEQLQPNGDAYMGMFTTGWAMPMQTHNNNPYDFGPVFKDRDCNKNKKHKIRVINRSGKKFPTGQIVMCTKMDGYWIIMDFGESNINTKAFDFGKWQFWKCIANKDSYRRDDRFHYDPNYATYHENIVRDSIYEGYFRTKFYRDIDKHLADTVTEPFTGSTPPPTGSAAGTLPVPIARRCIDESNSATGGSPFSLSRMNGGWEKFVAVAAVWPVPGSVGFVAGGTKPLKPAVYSWRPKKLNFIGSRRYMQTTSFDQLSHKHGGNAQANMLGAINPWHDETGAQIESVVNDEYYHRKLYPHWGPVLKTGYTEASITSLGTTDQNGNGKLKGYRAGGTETSTHGVPSAGYLLNAVSEPLADVKLGETYVNLGWSNYDKNVFNADDGMGIHIPADVGTNAAPYSENGAPIEDMVELLRCVNVVDPGAGAQGISPGTAGSPPNTAPGNLGGGQQTITGGTSAGASSSLGYTAGNGPDIMDSINSIGWVTASQDIVAGVRSYLCDAVDALYDVNTITGHPPAAHYTATTNSTPTNPTFLSRGMQKSWRLGERPNQPRWVYMAKADGADPTGALPESLYNLPATAPNKITFTPITAEHFGTFDARSAAPPNLDLTYSFNNWVGEQVKSIYNSANELFKGSSVGRDEHVFPANFLIRNGGRGSWPRLYGRAKDGGGDRIRYAGGGYHGDDVATIILNHRSAGMLPNGQMRMSANGDLWESTDSLFALLLRAAAQTPRTFSLPGNFYGMGIPYGIYTRHKHKYGKGGQGFAPNDIWTGMDDDGVAAVGIASAKCTIKVRGYEVAIKSTMNAGIPRQVPRGYQRWGSSSDLETDFGTTAGYVKLYDAWPEEQTIFDPRYFAVMHFNPGQLLTIASGKFVGDPNQASVAVMDSYNDMFRWVDNEETTVDYRIPTVSGAPGDVTTREIPNGSWVFRGVSYAPPNTTAPVGQKLQYAIREKSEWKVSTTRRGMLLPFKWKKKTIRLAGPKFGHNIQTYMPTGTNAGYSLLDLRTTLGGVTVNVPMWVEPSVWIASSGEGYQVGHTFEIQGGSPDLLGSVVITKVNTLADNVAAQPTNGGGPIGAIIEIRPGDHVTSPNTFSLGEGYDPDSFVSWKDYLLIRAMDPNHPVTQAPALRAVDSVNPGGQANVGVGAVIYALNGQCSTIDKLDVGPLKQSSSSRFTAASNGRGGARQLAPYARKVSIPRPNKDYAYDIFLQHHNDASHVFMHSNMLLDKKAQFTDVEIIGV